MTGFIYYLAIISTSVDIVQAKVVILLTLTSICLLLKTLLMLELKAAPENMEVTGYVKSRTFLNTEVISYREIQR